jgi:molybdate transport system substrate-binding protein
VLIAAAVVAGCSDGDASGSARAAGGAELTVFAAASLTDAFSEVGEAFEAQHDGVRVRFSFGASSTVREQVMEGAPADVVATASPGPMEDLQDAGLVDPPRVLATNRLQLAVPAGNPAGVSGLADLARGDLLIGVCDRDVPCGALAVEVLEAAGVVADPDTEEPDVRALLTKIGAGELDAGLVYATDVLASPDDVDGIDLPDTVPSTTEYPIATIREAPKAAQDFVAFAVGDAGQRILRAHGFGAP